MSSLYVRSNSSHVGECAERLNSPALWAISMENQAFTASVNAFPVASKSPP